MDKPRTFEAEVQENIQALGADKPLGALSVRWMVDAARHGYTHNFRWLGLPIIQFPQDIIAMQEIVWGYQPDLIVETGVARGGSLIFYASLLELIGNGEVLGIDIDIRKDNRAAIEGHPLFKRNRIRLIEGSSVDPAVVSEVHRRAATAKRTLVVLDSNHTHEHVLAELRAYAPLVRRGGHLVVMDTTIEDAPENLWPDRPWSKGNNPKTAVQEFLADTDRFEVDRSMQDKLLITVALGGYLRCIKDPA